MTRALDQALDDSLVWKKVIDVTAGQYVDITPPATAKHVRVTGIPVVTAGQYPIAVLGYDNGASFVGGAGAYRIASAYRNGAGVWNPVAETDVTSLQLGWTQQLASVAGNIEANFFLGDGTRQPTLSVVAKGYNNGNIEGLLDGFRVADSRRATSIRMLAADSSFMQPGTHILVEAF